MRSLVLLVTTACLAGCWGIPSVDCSTAVDCAALAERATESKMQAGYLAAACQLDHAESCAALGERFARAGDLQAARVYLGAGCQRGAANACTAAGNLAAGPGGDWPSNEQALTLFELGCRHGDGAACLEAARLHQGDNLLRHPEPDRAGHLKRKACEVGSADACFRLASNHRDQGDALPAMALFQQACELGDTAACEEHAQLADARVQKQEKQAAALAAELDAWCERVRSTCRRAKKCQKKFSRCRAAPERCETRRQRCLRRRAPKCDLEALASERFNNQCAPARHRRQR
jgi:hypothetical protein